MVTDTITFNKLGEGRAQTLVVENCREQCTQETPEQRRRRGYITEMFPQFSVDRFFTDFDEIWSASVSETSTDIDRRARNVLDRIFEVPGNEDTTFISITTHQGFINAFLKVLGRGAYDLPQGGVLPVVCKFTLGPLA